MGQLTNRGYVAERLDEIVENLETGFKRIYGDDINVDPDSPDGQMIGLIAQIKADFEELGESIYRALDPDYASGAWLEQRVAYAGLMRKRASYSYIFNVIFNGRVGTVVLANSIVQDELAGRWEVLSDVSIDETGEGRGILRSVEMGSFDVPVSSKFEMITRILGWDGLTLSEPSTIGENEETDASLRTRFFQSRARPAQNSVDGIVATIAQLPDVSEVVCLENWTNETDSNDVPAHSINVIVDGGTEDEIGRIVFDRKTAGTGMLGSVRVDLKDNAGRSRYVLFDRPTLVNCAARITLKRQENFTNIDVEAIKTAISRTSFAIGQDVLLSRLYTPINTVAGFWVESLAVGKVGGSLGAENIQINVREKARFSVSDIEVYVI